jgi:hypothetical protein
MSAAIWLEQWSNANEKNPDQPPAKYVGVYALLIGISICGLVFSCWSVVPTIRVSAVTD